MGLIRTLRVAHKMSEMFPEGCKTGNELNWMLKGNCPACVASPIERMSILEYRNKYPAENTLTMLDDDGSFTTQDIIEIRNCPLCGKRFMKGRCI